MKNTLQKTKIFSGVLWSFLMRWSTKFIGLVNTMVLARLLTPDDFGIVAMGAIVIAFVEELSTVNIPLLLIRSKNQSKILDDSGWTFGVLQSIVTAIILIALAPFAVKFFGDARVEEVIYFLAGIRIIVSFRNIGLVIARRDLNFSLDFNYMIIARIISLISVLLFAYFLRNYWALVYGLLVAEVINVMLSYIIVKYRPRFSLSHIVDCFKFGLSTIPLFFARTLSFKFDVLLVGRVSGTEIMGMYNVANELVSIFTNELVISASRGLFPNLSLLAKNHEEFKKVYLQIIIIAISLSVPIGFGLWIVANSLVLVILGKQWIESVVFIRWLVIYGVFASIISLMAEHPLIALKKEKQANYLVWLRLLILVPIVLYGYQLNGIVGIAMGMAVSATINFFLIGLIVCNILRVSFLNILINSFRPIVSGLLMCYVIYSFQTNNWGSYLFTNEFLKIAKDFIPAIYLFIEIIIGAIVYISCVLLLWIIQRRPMGIESMIFNKVSKR